MWPRCLSSLRCLVLQKDKSRWLAGPRCILSTALLLPLLLLLHSSSSSSSSWLFASCESLESEHFGEDDLTETAAGERLIWGTLGGSPAESFLYPSAPDSPFLLTEKLASDVALEGSETAAAAAGGEPVSSVVAAEDGGAKANELAARHKRRKKTLGLAAAAALLLLGAFSLSAASRLQQRFAAAKRDESQVEGGEPSPKAGGAAAAEAGAGAEAGAAAAAAAAMSLEELATAAAARVQGLMMKAGDVERLTELLRSETAAEILQRFNASAFAAKMESRRINSLLDKRRRLEQQEETQSLEDREKDEVDALGRWGRLCNAYEAALAELPNLLEATQNSLSDYQQKLCQQKTFLGKVEGRLRALVEKAAAVFHDQAPNPLQVHALASRFLEQAAEREAKELHAVMQDLEAAVEQQQAAAAAAGTAWTPTSAAAAHNELLLGEALVAAQITSEIRSRVDFLMQDSLLWLKDAEENAFAVARSSAAAMDVKLMGALKHLELARFIMQSTEVPEEFEDLKGKILIASVTIEGLTEQMCEMRERIRTARDPEEALEGLRVVQLLETCAAAEAAAAPAIRAVTASFPDEDGSMRSGFAVSFYGGLHAGLPLLKGEADGDADLNKNFQKLLSATTAAAVEISEATELGHMGDEVKWGLNSLKRCRHLSGPLPSREHYNSWKDSLFAAGQKRRDLKSALQIVRLGAERGVLQTAAKDAIHRAKELAALSLKAVDHASKAKAWLRTEAALASALEAHGQVVAALQTAEQQQQQLQHEEEQQQQQEDPVVMRSPRTLQNNADEVVQKQDLNAAIRLAANIGAEVSALRALLRERQAAIRRSRGFSVASL